SKAFELEFPVDDLGQPKPLELAIRIECPDFEPKVSIKTVFVPPAGDSEACTFLITPLYLGELRVNVEVIKRAVLIASRTLKTEATASDREIDVAKVLVSIPLPVIVRDAQILRGAVQSVEPMEFARSIQAPLSGAASRTLAVGSMIGQPPNSPVPSPPEA